MNLEREGIENPNKCEEILPGIILYLNGDGVLFVEMMFIDEINNFSGRFFKGRTGIVLHNFFSGKNSLEVLFIYNLHPGFL